jgi:transcriptional regulator with XRE-family HTH domain
MLQTDLYDGRCNYAHMDAEQERTRRLVEEMLRVTSLTPTELARKAGLSPSTLTRFLNSSEAKHALSNRTLQKLAEASGRGSAMLAPEIWPRWQRLRPEHRALIIDLADALLTSGAEDDEEDAPPRKQAKGGRR